jgi:predicted dehydrogenase
LARSIYYARAAALRRRGVPARGVFTVKKLNGGGPLIDIGVHALDLAVWLMGNPRSVGVYGAAYDRLAHRPEMAAQNVGSWGPFDPERYDVEDLCTGLVRFAGGATLFLETSWLLNQDAPEVRRTDVYGTAGSATTNPFRILVDDGTILQDVTPDIPQGREANQGNFLRFKRFVECVKGRAKPLVLPEESLDVQRIIDALYASAETGKAIEIAAD